MRRFLMTAAVAAGALAATPSFAAITISNATPTSTTYMGPAPTFTFDTVTPGLVGGTILYTSTTSGTTSTADKPIGSTGGYLATGPMYGTATLTSALFTNAKTISLLWGSVDPGNLLEFLDASGNVLASFNGNQVNSATGGFPTYDSRRAPTVYFSLTGTDSSNLSSLRFSSSTDSFELDNVSVAVPEPATWGLMVLGFAAVGMGLRRRKNVRTSVSFA